MNKKSISEFIDLSAINGVSKKLISFKLTLRYWHDFFFKFAIQIKKQRI